MVLAGMTEGSSLLFSCLLASRPGRVLTVKAGEQEGKCTYTMLPGGLSSVPAHRHFCLIQLAKASPKASLDFSSGEIDFTSLVREAGVMGEGCG